MSEQCISLECDVVDLPRGSVSLDIIGYIDERFYHVCKEPLKANQLALYI